MRRDEMIVGSRREDGKKSDQPVLLSCLNTQHNFFTHPRLECPVWLGAAALDITRCACVSTPRVATAYSLLLVELGNWGMGFLGYGRVVS